MAIEHNVDRALRLITITGPGGGIDAIADSAGRLLNDVSLGRDFSLLFLVPSSETPEPEDLMKMAELLGLVTARFDGRIAVVTPNVGQMTPAALLTTMVDDGSGSGRVRAFSSELSARAWVLKGGQPA